jgi:ferrous iron transport protein B
VEQLVAQIEQSYPGLPNARWVAMRLLEGDKRVEDAIRTGEIAELVAEQQRQPAAVAHH